MLGADAAELLAPLRREPRRSAVLSDVDGTLAPIVADPEQAAVPGKTREVLAALCDRFALVAFVTGRRALEARRMVGVEGATYAGNHGLEILEPGAEEPAMAEAVAERGTVARRLVEELDLGELRHEDKGPIQALHWRATQDPERARSAAAEIAASAEGRGLFPHWGRQVLELRPTESVDKGSAARSLLSGRDIAFALFGGDDRTDLDAFDALGEMTGAGELEAAVRIGVDSEEAPAELPDRSDAIVDGTLGFLDVLRALADED